MALNPLDADLSLDLTEGNTLATPLTGHGCSELVRSWACHALMGSLHAHSCKLSTSQLYYRLLTGS